MKTRYITKITNTGGRSGKSYSEDGTFDVKISRPGSGEEGTNPEQLFAAGFSACFNSALSLVLQREKVKADSTVSVTVTLYEREAFDYLLGVEIEGHVEGLSKEETMKMLEKANQVCPYSKATHGNIEATLKAV